MGWTQQKRDALHIHILMNADKKSAHEISQELSVGVSTVQQNATKLGVKLKAAKRMLPKAKEIRRRIRFIKKHGAGLTIKRMAQHFGLTYNSLHALVHYYGLPFKPECPLRGPGKAVARAERKQRFFNPDKPIY